MPIMPHTGADLRVGDIHETEPNVHGGVKYIRLLINDYFKDEPINQFEQGALCVRVVQRKAGTDSSAAARGGAAGSRSERVVGLSARGR
jgi:hypothetical protein